MILLLLILYVTLMLNKKYNDSKNSVIIYALISFLFPVTYFVNLDFGVQLLQAANFEKTIVSSYMAMSAIYLLYQAIENNYKEFSLDNNTFMFLAIALLNNFYAIIFFIFALIYFSEISMHDKELKVGKRLVYFVVLAFTLGFDLGQPYAKLLYIPLFLMLLDTLFKTKNNENIISMFAILALLDESSAVDVYVVYLLGVIVVVLGLYSVLVSEHRNKVKNFIRENKIVAPVYLKIKLRYKQYWPCRVVEEEQEERLEPRYFAQKYHYSDTNLSFILLLFLASLLLLIGIVK